MLIKPIGIVVEMLVQNKVGHEKWGKYAALYSLCHISVSLADLGLNQFLTKEIANSIDTQKELSAKILGIKIISSLLFPILMLGIGCVLGYDMYWLKILFFVAITHSFIQFFGFYRAQIQGNQLFGFDAITSNLDKVLLIFISLALFYSSLTIWTYTFGRIASIGLGIIVIIYLCKKEKLLLMPIFKFNEMGSVIQKGLPFTFIALVYSINENIDQVMVERLSTSTDYNHSAIYAAAYRLVNAIMMYLWIVLPMFFAKFSHFESDKTSINKLIKTGTTLVFLPIALVSIFSIFHSNKLFILFKDSTNLELEAMSALFAILCITLLLQGMFAILSTYLTAKGHEKYVTKLVLLSILFNIGTNYILIPKFGAFAAAWATFGSALIVVIGYLYKIQSQKLIELPYQTWIKLLSISIVSALAYHFGAMISEISSMLLGLIAFFGAIALLKPIELADIKKIN